jgi:hypothetical protein
MNRVLMMAAVALLGVAVSGVGRAASPDYLGSWTVQGSEPAPWASPADKPVASDLKALIGKTVVFRADRIEAPAPLGCRKPHYEIKQYDPDMLFQGSLTRPKAQATTLGFSDSKIPTLETGCEGAIDFHFAGDAAMFALNNRVYKMVRTKPPYR